jgi:hypothetical protein
MGRMSVAGHRTFGRNKLEEYNIERRKMVNNSEEGQAPYRAFEPAQLLMTVMLMMK